MVNGLVEYNSGSNRLSSFKSNKDEGEYANGGETTTTTTIIVQWWARKQLVQVTAIQLHTVVIGNLKSSTHVTTLQLRDNEPGENQSE